MPHLVILYSGGLDSDIDMSTVCQALADAMRGVQDELGKPVFPTGGIRVFAYPAPYSAVADNGAAGRAAGESGDYGFAYLNLRMGAGRSAFVIEAVGNAIMAAARTQLEPLLQHRRVGLTFQIDLGSQVFDAKFGNLHSLFQQGGKSC